MDQKHDTATFNFKLNCFAAAADNDTKMLDPTTMVNDVTDTLQHLTYSKPKMHDWSNVRREDFDGGPVSLDEIEPGLFLGNLTAATHMETLKCFKINHILTLDTVPLPQHITEASFLKIKYVQIADVPREDILHHLEECVEFIESALASNGNILVHCYFGVSRSSSAVIAYVMKKHHLDYNGGFELVKSKRRFVQPNAGFASQLKLYHRMGCKIDSNYQKYKLYRLRMAGDLVRKAKILPQNLHSLIKKDPGITQENPEPIVYRCRKCRRVLATKSHVLEHKPKGVPPALLATVAISTTPTRKSSTLLNTVSTQTNTTRLLEQIGSKVRKVSLVAPIDGSGTLETAGNIGVNTHTCRSILFVEPIAWMQHITNNTQGRLNCPKCEQKLGNFSWINGCQCPCGESMAPAFYLIPSKVELSKAVQNVQMTV